MVAVTRKSQMGAKLEVNPAAVADVLKVLARHNPGLSKQALAATGKVMAVVSAVAARLSVEQQRRIADDETELAHIVEAAVAELAAKPGHVLAEVSVEKPVEVSRGAGLGQSVGIEEAAPQARRICDANPHRRLGRSGRRSGRYREKVRHEAIDLTRLAQARSCSRSAQGRAKACLSPGSVCGWPAGRGHASGHQNHPQSAFSVAMVDPAEAKHRRNAARQSQDGQS